MWSDGKTVRQINTDLTEMLPAGGQIVSYLTLAMLTEVLIIFRTGGCAVHKLLPFSRFEHSWRKKDLCLIDCSALQFAMFQFSLTIDVRFGFNAVVLFGFICNRSRKIFFGQFSEVQDTEYSAGYTSVWINIKMLSTPSGHMVIGTHLILRASFIISFILFLFIPLFLFSFVSCFVSKLVTLTTSDMSDVNLLLFETGCLADVTWSVVSDAVTPTDRIVIVAIAYDVAHAAGHTHII